MDKIWYIKIHGNREGPYSVLDLKRDRRITPDTLVWRQGFDKWQPIRYVPELKVIFEDDEKTIVQDYEPRKATIEDDEIVLEMRGNQPNKWFWLIVAIVVFLWLYLWR